jgi:hypothetical protein
VLGHDFNSWGMETCRGSIPPPRRFSYAKALTWALACANVDFESSMLAEHECQSISGLVVEYIVAIDVTRVRFPADAFCDCILCACLFLCEMTAVGFEPTQLSLVELESTPLDHSGKLSMDCEVLELLDNCRVHARCNVFEGTRRTSVPHSQCSESIAWCPIMSVGFR